MGKGDKKTKRGKIAKGTHGAVRPKKKKKIVGSAKDQKADK
jgi:ribosomal small subunit protein bTHX